MKTARDMISELSDDSLELGVLEVQGAEMKNIQYSPDGILMKLAQDFRNNLNIMEVNTFVLAKKLVIEEAAYRWLKLKNN